MASRHHLVLVMGVPGSGKTTLSHQVVRQVNWVYINNDLIIDPFFSDTRDSPDHSRLRPKFYEVFYNIAAHNLKLGNTVLLDAPHVRPMKDPLWWAQMQSLATSAGASLKVVRCYCSETTLRARLTARKRQRDEPKLRNWEQFLTDEPIRAPIPVDHREIDTDIESDASAQVLAYVADGEPSRLPMKNR